MAIDLDVHGNTKPLEAAVQAAINRIRRQPIKITVDDKGATQPLGNMKRAADEFSKSMEAANARILAFGASMAIINGVADAFKGMVRNLVEVEKSLADINVVMGLSTQNLDKFGDGLFKVAKETGAAFRVAADAATEYARQGLAVEETLKRTRDALVLTRLTGMDSAEAVKSLTAAMNTYGNQIKDTTQLVSKFAAVDVQFAVSAEDFAAAISRTGQAAKSAGVDIDELIGIVTSAQQQTARGGAVIGNALKTIFTKTGRTDTLNQLENLGIAVRDLEGNTIGAKRILTDLANTFDTLSEAQKAQITQTMGGLFHINILKAVLSDAAKQNGILANATQISANATDEAIQKNEQLRQTMSAMATETGLAIKQLSVQIGELMLAPGMEKILNAVKSIAEGAGDLLGDGESAGSKFANGFLKGLGNIITGPGLVVLSAVFIKLFATAVKFTKESLTSLIGVTSEAQKQKAIQTSLVALIGQNAALGKEILRTDVSRTEKEKILLGLLRMQTAEAENLNRVSKQLASTLYTKGYGPGLTTGKRRAYGHIPNYADPERAQAARGGYAAGSIRAMNMPGEGSVIYNSAETVKNFAGFKQPAIMPPQSSKAGKNYQQAFGSIHGFDPYAAGGYIPNFSKPTLADLTTRQLGRLKAGEKVKFNNEDYYADDFGGKKTVVDFSSELKNKNTKYRGPSKISLAAMLVPREGYKFKQGDAAPYASYGTGKDKMSWPVYTLKSDLEKNPTDLTNAVKKKFESVGSKYSTEVSQLVGGGNITPNKFWKEIENDRAGGGKGAWKAAVGAIFEAAINAALGYKAADGHPEQGNFDVRGGREIQEVRKLFHMPPGIPVADYKSNSASRGNRQSFRDKVVKERMFRESQLKNKARGAAFGYIPNFADPLSDAIGREKAAGVPVSQIRVGSHSALMSKGNPLGLGVTNTYDEPNGLRDVFGANGFVPNYAEGFTRSDVNISGRNFSAQDKLIEKLNRRLKAYIEKFKAGEINQKQLNDGIERLSRRTKDQAAAIETANKVIRKSITTREKLNAMMTRASTAFQGSAIGGFSKSMGKAFSGNAGMAMMMGAPMAAGFLQSGNLGTTGVGGASYIAGGGLTGAASGGMMASMIAPMFGPAAPLVIGVGALVGAVHGMTSASEENTKALEEKAKQELVAQKQSAATAFSGIIQGGELSRKISSTNISETAQSRLGLGPESSVIEALQKSAEKYQMPASLKIMTDKLLGTKDKAPSWSGYMSEQQINEFRKEYPFKEQYPQILDKAESELSGAERKLIGSRPSIANARRSIQYQKQSKEFVGLPMMADAPQASAVRQREADVQKKRIEARGEIIDFLMENEKQESFAVNFGEKGTGYLSKTQYANLLKGKEVDVGGKIGKQTLSEEAIRTELVAQSNKIESEYKNKKAEQVRGIILQLNLQKAQIQAQKAASDAQLDIKSKFLEQSSLLDSQEKLLSGFMSEEQKVRIKYNKSLLKASEVYESGAAQAASAFKTGILQDITQNTALQSALKQELFKGEDASGKTLMDLTSKLSEMDTTELEAILSRISSKHKEANEILTNRGLIYDNQLDTLKKQQELSNRQGEIERDINMKIAERKSLMEDVNQEMQAYINKLNHEAKLREISSQIATARFNAGPARTQEERFIHEQGEVLRRQKGIEDRFEEEELNKIKGFGDKVGLSLEQRKKILKDPSSLSDVTATAIKSKEDKFSEMGGMTKALQLRMQTQESAKFIGPRTEAQMQSQAEDLTKLNQLETLQSSINDATEEQRKESERITKELKKRLKEKDSEIAKEQELLDIQRQEYARKTGPGAFGEGMKDARIEMGKQVKMMDYELGQKIPFAFADGMANAMTEALNGTKNIKEALTDAAISFLGMIQKAMMQKAAYSLVGAMGFSRGGNVRNYSRGGGVPAMVSNGEYVMGRDAVAKYGGSFMHGLNAGGKIPGFSNGGKLADQLVNVRREKVHVPGGAQPGSALASGFGGGRGHASGRAYQSRAMSGFFYSQSGNVGLGEDTSTMMGILQEEERRRQEAEAKRQAKKAKRRQLIGSLVGIAAGAALSHFAGGFGKGPSAESLGRDIDLAAAPEFGKSQFFSDHLTKNFPASSSFSTPKKGGYSSLVNSTYGGTGLDRLSAGVFGRYLGGPIRKYASGGYISGKSGIDQIPAMLSEGEYVIRASSARQLGKPMLDRINAGKFNEGGAVSELMGSSETAASGGNTNNISISINMERGSGSKKENQSQDNSGQNPADRSSDEQNSAALADRIKQQVVAVIVEEQRPGGLLSE